MQVSFPKFQAVQHPHFGSQQPPSLPPSDPEKPSGPDAPKKSRSETDMEKPFGEGMAEKVIGGTIVGFFAVTTAAIALLSRRKKK